MKNKGFTLVEVLVAIMIFAVGILAVAQLVVMAMRANRALKDYGEAKEILAKGIEVLKNLPHNDVLLTDTCDSLQLDDTSSAFKAGPGNIVGQTIGTTQYVVFWNVADFCPDTGFKTIRMHVFNSENRLMQADYVKWR